MKGSTPYSKQSFTAFRLLILIGFNAGTATFDFVLLLSIFAEMRMILIYPAISRGELAFVRLKPISKNP